MDILIFGDTQRSTPLRHEIPAPIGDPFLYGERGGRPFVVASLLEADDVARVRPDAEFVLFDDLGLDELLAEGWTADDVRTELALRACRRFGVERAAVPAEFPLQVADHLRAGGIELAVDVEQFNRRLRRKSEAELDGIRRAAQAAEAGASAVVALLAAAEPGADGVLTLDGAPLTCEALQEAAEEAARINGARLDELIVSSGPDSAIGHATGSGPVRAGESVVCDLWPQDRDSGCFADFTRTFVAGAAPDEELIAWHNLCRDALQRVLDATAPGVTGQDLWEIACDVFEAAGQPTHRTKAEGERLEEGFVYALGHGLGLDVHEAPYIGRSGEDELQAGDAIALEPSLFRPGYAGVRLEDTVLVTEDGCEVLTRFGYELRI